MNYTSGFFLPIYTKTGLYYLSKEEYNLSPLLKSLDNFSENLIDLTYTDFTTENLYMFFKILSGKKREMDENTFRTLCLFFGIKCPQSIS
jgi:hypothetical protein